MIRTYTVTLTEGQLMLVRMAVNHMRRQEGEGTVKYARLKEVEKELDNAIPTKGDKS